MISEDPMPTVLDTRAQNAPARLSPEAKQRVRQAAMLSTRVYPGPVGELVRHELFDWEQFGYRFGRGLVQRLVDHILEAAEELPTEDAA